MSTAERNFQQREVMTVVEEEGVTLFLSKREATAIITLVGPIVDWYETGKKNKSLAKDLWGIYYALRSIDCFASSELVKDIVIFREPENN